MFDILAETDTVRSGYNSIKVFSSCPSHVVMSETRVATCVWLGHLLSQEITLLSLLSGSSSSFKPSQCETSFFLVDKKCVCSRGGARSSKVCHEGNRNVWRKWLMPTRGGDGRQFSSPELLLTLSGLTVTTNWEEGLIFY